MALQTRNSAPPPQAQGNRSANKPVTSEFLQNEIGPCSCTLAELADAGFDCFKGYKRAARGNWADGGFNFTVPSAQGRGGKSTYVYVRNENAPQALLNAPEGARVVLTGNVTLEVKDHKGQLVYNLKCAAANVEIINAQGGGGGGYQGRGSGGGYGTNGPTNAGTTVGHASGGYQNGRNESIERQCALKAAVEVGTSRPEWTVEDVLAVAAKFAAFIAGAPVASASPASEPQHEEHGDDADGNPEAEGDLPF